MRLYIAVFTWFYLLCSLAGAEEWKEMKSGHFIVYYLDDSSFAYEVSARAETYYDKIASDLGYARYDNFWQWENRAKIYIYRESAEYHKATRAPSWSSGFANYQSKEVFSFARSPDFVETLLPHELAHLIFRDFIGFKADAPAWLDEGVAQWEEESKRKIAAALFKEYIYKKEVMPISQLTQMNIGAQADAAVSRKFYVEALALVGFLIERYGNSRFTLFCRELRDGKSIDKALGLVYPDSIRNTSELEREWMRHYEQI